MQLVVYGNELLFSEALASLLTRRGQNVLACPVFTSDLIEIAESNDVDAYLIDVSTTSDVTAIAQIKNVAPSVPVVILHSDSDSSLLSAALDAGAIGVCLKVDTIEEIESMLLRVSSPRHQNSTTAIWSARAHGFANRRNLAPQGTTITPKEKAVLELLVQGTPTEAIATQLAVSKATVRTHLQHLFDKFGVHSRVALIAATVNETTARARTTAHR